MAATSTNPSVTSTAVAAYECLANAVRQDDRRMSEAYTAVADAIREEWVPTETVVELMTHVTTLVELCADLEEIATETIYDLIEDEISEEAAEFVAARKLQIDMAHAVRMFHKAGRIAPTR